VPKRSIVTFLAIFAVVALMSPLTGSAAADRRQATPEAAAQWRLIHGQTFESEFIPDNSLWSLRDNNGPSVGVKVDPSATLIWDDNSTRARTGFWSAHPNDWNGSANHTDTYMRYGPFSLVGARNARVRFSYWLNTERNYDFFSWEYSCNNDGNWKSTMVSGQPQVWRDVIWSLAECVGSANVMVRWNFRSDYSNPASNAPTGVWVDDIRIQKYS